jgi:hypothetical protein
VHTTRRKTIMGTKFSTLFRCLGAVALLALAAGLSPQPTFAQNVDKSVFQMEGDAAHTATICWLPIVNGGPAIATPVASGTNNTDGFGCPTINPAGAAATWSLISFNSEDDWASFVFSSGAFTVKGNSLFVPSFVTDAVNSQTDNTFLGTASKDTQDISQWTWNPHGTQDKDDIEHAFAGAYNVSGDTVIYAGMDRFANAGDSTAGFWFVQDSNFALCVGLHLAATGNGGTVANNNCTASGTFVGHHTDGDLLVVSDFSVGGAVSTINIFKWSGGASGSLALDLTRSPAPCDPLNGGNSLCGLVNNAFTQSVVTKGGKSTTVLTATNVGTGGWAFHDKGGFFQYQTGEFLEIAVDLNAIFGANVPCFSTFFSETRSSTSATASLSDLTTPVSFPLCSLSVSKSCTSSQLINGGPSVQYSFGGTVTNTGSGTIYNVTITDAPTATCPDCGPPTGATNLSITCTHCNDSGGVPGSGGTVSYTGTFTSPGVLGTGQTNKVQATASSNSSGTPQNVDGTVVSNDFSSCAPPIAPGLSVDKKCESCLQSAGSSGGLVVQVKEGVHVCNTGNDNITNLNVEDCRGTPGPAPGTPGALAFADSENDATCSIAFVNLGGATSLAAATGCNSSGQSCTTPTCETLTNNETPNISQCTQFDPSTSPPSGGNCSFSDMVYVHGSAAGFGAILQTNSTSCPLCPINTSCPPITF